MSPSRFPSLSKKQIQQLREKFTSAVRSICAVAVDGKAHLLAGFWCFMLRSQQPENPIADAFGNDAGSHRAEEEVLMYHVSFVWGGLKYFSPVLLKCGFSILDHQDAAQSAASVEWPERVKLMADKTDFQDYWQFLQGIDSSKKWTLTAYQLMKGATPIGDFVAGEAVALKCKAPPIPVWHGPQKQASQSGGGASSQAFQTLMDEYLGMNLPFFTFDTCYMLHGFEPAMIENKDMLAASSYRL